MKLDTKRLAAVIAYAKDLSAGKQRLIRAIDRAVSLIREGHFEYDNATGTLTVIGSGLNRYVATPMSCQCKAFTEFNDSCCRHRIAVRLLWLYHDAPGVVTAASRPEQNATAPAIDPTTHEHFCPVCRQPWLHSDDDCSQGRELICLECFKDESADHPEEAIVDLSRARRRVCGHCYTDVFEADRCPSHRRAPIVDLSPEQAEQLRETRYLSDSLRDLANNASRRLEAEERENAPLIKRPINQGKTLNGWSI
jgi:hypothetical protein